MVTGKTLHQLFNQALSTGEFSINLQDADITSVCKKKNHLHKENYRPVSVLPIISKLFEKLMQNQILHTKIKINLIFSAWSELLQCVPQGTVLEPNLFNIYFNDLFYLTEMTYVSNFADDTKFYMCDKSSNSLTQALEHDTAQTFEWFENNFIMIDVIYLFLNINMNLFGKK